MLNTAVHTRLALVKRLTVRAVSLRRLWFRTVLSNKNSGLLISMRSGNARYSAESDVGAKALRGADRLVRSPWSKSGRRSACRPQRRLWLTTWRRYRSRTNAVLVRSALWSAWPGSSTSSDLDPRRHPGG